MELLSVTCGLFTFAEVTFSLTVGHATFSSDPLRIRIFRGHLLRGTGCSICNADLARALAGLRHEVHMFCQDSTAPPPKGVTLRLLDIGRLLPVLRRGSL